MNRHVELFAACALAPAISPLVTFEEGVRIRAAERLYTRGCLMWRGVLGLPGQWAEIDPTLADVDPATGELTLPWNFSACHTTKCR